MSRIHKSIETESRSVVAMDYGKEEWRMTPNRYGVSLGEDKMFWN